MVKNCNKRSCSKVHQITLPAALHNNQFSLLADDKEDNIDDDEEPTTAAAYLVLDHDTGETLEHRQLRHLPKYKAMWDKSYADKIGLCFLLAQAPFSIVLTYDTVVPALLVSPTL